MKQSNNRGSVAMLFSLLIAIFIVFGVNKAFADPQPLPFNFIPGIGDLEWVDIDNTAGDPSTGSPFSGECGSEGGTGLTILDAEDADGNTDAYDSAWVTTVNGTFVGTNGVGDLTGNTYTGNTQIISRLFVTYQLYFSADTQCNRLVLFFENPLNIPVSETVRIATNFGSDGSTKVVRVHPPAAVFLQLQIDGL